MKTKTIVSVAWSAAQPLQCCLPCQNIQDHQSVPAQPFPAAEDSQIFVCPLLVSHLMQTQVRCVTVTGRSMTETQLSCNLIDLHCDNCMMKFRLKRVAKQVSK